MNGQHTRRIGVLGVGNLLLRDEGFGVHCIRHLDANYRFPEGVEVLDGGTSGLFLAPFLERWERAIVIDCVALDEPPGTVRTFSRGELETGLIPTRMSPHQVGILEILAICELRGKAPRQVEFFAVVPQDISTGVDLSATLAEKVPEVAAMVVERLAALGYAVRPAKGKGDA